MSEQDAVIESDADDAPSDDEILAAVGEPDEPQDDEPQEEELEEVEWDEGKKVKVTKGFKDALLREKDYRHKTHGLSQKERTLEAKERELAETFKLREAMDDERAELKALDKRLSEYDKVTPEQWLAWREQDEKAVSDAQFARDMLKQQREKLMASMKEKYETLTAKEKEKLATWEAENAKAVKEKVPDWSEERAKTVAEHIAPKFGLKAEALAKAKDAGVIALLDYVYKQDKAIEAAKAKVAAARREQMPTPEPVGKVGGGRAGAPQGPTPQTLKHNPANFDRAIQKMIYGGP